MSKDIFRTKLFLFLSAFVFLALAFLIVLIAREDPDGANSGLSPSNLFSLSRSGPDNPDNPFTRPDSDNLPVTALAPGDEDGQEQAQRPGALVFDANAGQREFTEAPVTPTTVEPESDAPGQADAGSTDNAAPELAPEILPEPSPETEPATTPEAVTEQPTIDSEPAAPEVETPVVTPAEPDPTGLTMPSVLPHDAVVSSATQESGTGNVATRVDLAVGSDAVVLRIEGNAPLSARWFVLTEPDRVVLDLSGSWRVQLPEVPANAFVGALRQGIQPDATRVVLDMREAPGSVNLEQIGTQVIELRVQ